MPPEQFHPTPSPEPEELPREVTRFDLKLPDLEGRKKESRKKKVEPPPIPLEALGIEEITDAVETVKPEGPPPIPEAAKRKGPPPIPKAVREASIEAARKQMENIQEQDVVSAFEVRGFQGLEVAATLEKKKERLGSPENHNEDNILIDPETGLVGVLDGLGGEGEAGAGARASKAAELVIPEAYKQAKEEISKIDATEVQKRLVEQQLTKSGNPESRKEITILTEQLIELDPRMAKEALALIESIRGANDAVKDSGGKTTALISKMHETPDGRRFALIANVGDCVAYKQRASGEILQITEEDSALNSLKRAGVLDEDLLGRMKQDKTKNFPIPLTLKVIRMMGGDEQQLKQFESKGVKSLPLSFKTLKRAMVAGLGGEVFEPSLTVRELRKGESLFFVTDGESDVVEDPITGEVDTEQVLKDMATERLQSFFDPQGNVDMNRLKKHVMSLPLTERLNNMRSAAAKRETKDDDVGITAITAM